MAGAHSAFRMVNRRVLRVVRHHGVLGTSGSRGRRCGNRCGGFPLCSRVAGTRRSVACGRNPGHDTAVLLAISLWHHGFHADAVDDAQLIWTIPIDSGPVRWLVPAVDRARTGHHDKERRACAVGGHGSCGSVRPSQERPVHTRLLPRLACDAGDCGSLALVHVAPFRQPVHRRLHWTPDTGPEREIAGGPQRNPGVLRHPNRQGRFSMVAVAAACDAACDPLTSAQRCGNIHRRCVPFLYGGENKTTVVHLARVPWARPGRRR